MKAHYCPVCNREIDAFEAFNGRPAARCPFCKSLERHRLLWLYLNNETRYMEQKTTLLHFAPEKMLYNLFSSTPGISYQPVDLYPEGYPYPVYKHDITDLGYHAATFDLVLCSHVLEHIDDDIRAMREIGRVLKPTGTALLQVPIDLRREVSYEDFRITTPEGRKKAFGQSDHVRIYGRDFVKRLQIAGFRIKIEIYSDGYTSAEIEKMGLINGDMLFKANCY